MSHLYLDCDFASLRLRLPRCGAIFKVYPNFGYPHIPSCLLVIYNFLSGCCYVPLYVFLATGLSKYCLEWIAKAFVGP